MRTWELPSCEMHFQEPENHAMDMENFPGKGIRNKQVSDTEFFYKFSNLRKGIHTKLDFR